MSHSESKQDRQDTGGTSWHDDDDRAALDKLLAELHSDTSALEAMIAESDALLARFLADHQGDLDAMLAQLEGPVELPMLDATEGGRQ